MPRRLLALRETLKALLLVARTTVLFRLRGNAAVTAVTRKGMTATPSSRADLEARGVDPWLLLRALQRARALSPLPVRCLQTAIVFRELLRSHGLDGVLRVGVRKSPTDDVEAHAWVEVADFAFDPDRLDRGFLPLDGLPASERAS